MPPEPLNTLNYIQFGVIVFLIVITGMWRERYFKALKAIYVIFWKSLHSIPNIKEISMTVDNLETAKNIVSEAPDMVAAVYEYTHAITGQKLYSVESSINRGATESSGFVINPRIIWTPENGWSV